MIKFMGRFPSRPAKMGEMKFDDFQKQAIDGWNIGNDPETAEFQKLGETLLTMEPEEFGETDPSRTIVALKKLLSLRQIHSGQFDPLILTQIFHVLTSFQ